MLSLVCTGTSPWPFCLASSHWFPPLRGWSSYSANENVIIWMVQVCGDLSWGIRSSQHSSVWAVTRLTCTADPLCSHCPWSTQAVTHELTVGPGLSHILYPTHQESAKLRTQTLERWFWVGWWLCWQRCDLEKLFNHFKLCVFHYKSSSMIVGIWGFFSF